MGKRAILIPEDEVWFKTLFNLIPTSVYRGNQTLPALQKQPNKKGTEKDENGKEQRRVPRKKNKNKEKVFRPAESESSERVSLRERLQNKISEKRAERKADDENQISVRENRKRKRDERNAEREKEAKKARRGQKFEKLKKQKQEHKEQQREESKKNDEQRKESQVIGEGSEERMEEREVEVETTRLIGFEDEEKINKVKQRKLKGGKLGKLQLRLAKAAEEQALKGKAEKGMQNTTQTVKGDDVSKERTEAAKAVEDREMDKALQKVQGKGVRDNVKKLKKSIRQEKRKTEKSREQWAQRVESLEKEKVARREQREKNLKERKESKGKSKSGKPKKKIAKTRKKK